VKDILEIGETVGMESQRLKDVDDLEFLDIDKTEQKSDSPGLTLPSWEEIGTGLKRNVQATNQAVITAEQEGNFSEDDEVVSFGRGDSVLLKKQNLFVKSWLKQNNEI
jgi:hypothetical protein